ncbi:MAG: hypothetical protein HZB26_11415 [Candidatus Hydrogenedentes bacterium]|nr:hypothetical protein [Candidatus Hydrogenedentota bacterium]
MDASATGYEGQIQVAAVAAFGVTVADFELTPGVVAPTLEDIDGSGDVNAVDVQLVINKALGYSISGDADVNRSGGVDAVDIQLVINAALAKKSTR